MSCRRAFLALIVLATAAWCVHPRAQCHANELAGFSGTAMAHSLSSPIPQSSGAFLHAAPNPAYQNLAAIYLEERERAKIRETFEQYLKAFPGSIEAQVALHTIGLVSP